MLLPEKLKAKGKVQKQVNQSGENFVPIRTIALDYYTLRTNTSDIQFKVERLSEYEQYFASLLVDTHPDHPDHHHLAHHHHTLTQPLGRVVTAMTMLHAGSAFDP
ncbi:uncharacterized protein [Procambarus clarkii]|uniref:uncharacterized protein isoform X1 n=1 Tax=Procambarus clarkii TaxID=6728 RepID=UPI0037430E6D